MRADMVHLQYSADPLLLPLIKSGRAPMGAMCPAAARAGSVDRVE